MQRSPLEALILEKSLSFVSRGDDVDLVLDQPDTTGVIKNVCAKVSCELSDEIDQVCGLLDIRKRRFLESCFIDGIAKAKQIMRDEGVFDHVELLSANRSNVQEIRS